MINRSGYFEKRGQLSLLILVSVLLVVAIVSFYLLRGNFGQNDIPGSENIREDIVECIEFTSKNALYFISYQGGYDTPPERYFSFSPTYYPYYYFEGESVVPSIEFIEDEMSGFVKENLGTCLDSLEESGFEIGYDIDQVAVEINEDGVDFVFDDSITLNQGDLSMQIDLGQYSQFYPVKLYDLYSMSTYFIDDLNEDPHYYCITCLTKMAEESGTKFYLFPMFDSVYLVMAFEDSIDPLVYNFVIKFEDDVNNS